MNAQELRAVQMQAPKPKTKGMTPLKFAGICTLSFSGSLALILMAAHGAFKSPLQKSECCDSVGSPRR